MEKSIEFLQDMFPLGREIIRETYTSNNNDLEKTISILISMCDTQQNYPPSYEEAVNSDVNPIFTLESNDSKNKKRRDSRRNLGKKEWKPPLVGNLPDDFLKVPNEISNNIASKGFLCKSCAKFSPAASNVTTIDDFQYSTNNPSIKASNLENMDSIIRKRMEENVSQTRKLTMSNSRSSSLATVGDEFQYLDDERLALMLQNQEFLNILQSDQEFQRALKEDEEEARGTESVEKEDIWLERSLDDISLRITPQDNEEDYGYQRSDIVDPDHLWPDHIGHNTSDENEVSKMCRAMGKASRKRFNSLAKRFPSIRKKRTSRNYNNFDITPGMSDQQGPGMPRSMPIGRPGVYGSTNWDTESTQNLIFTDDDDNFSSVSHSRPHFDNMSNVSVSRPQILLEEDEPTSTRRDTPTII